jgi:2-keto-4-pentenoate hydratase
MSGATEPDFRAMTDDLFLPEDTPLKASRFFRTLIGIEIAVVMKSALKSPSILPVDVLRATDFVVPSIEVVDFRVGPAPGMTVIDTVADLAACGAAVLGASLGLLEDIDLRRLHGQTILIASFVRALPVQPGDEVIARFDSGLGDVMTTFVGAIKLTVLV